jgi:hypothetical protein
VSDNTALPTWLAQRQPQPQPLTQDAARAYLKDARRLDLDATISSADEITTSAIEHATVSHTDRPNPLLDYTELACWTLRHGEDTSTLWLLIAGMGASGSDDAFDYIVLTEYNLGRSAVLAAVATVVHCLTPKQHQDTWTDLTYRPHPAAHGGATWAARTNPELRDRLIEYAHAVYALRELDNRPLPVPVLGERNY